MLPDISQIYLSGILFTQIIPNIYHLTYIIWTQVAHNCEDKIFINMNKSTFRANIYPKHWNFYTILNCENGDI